MILSIPAFSQTGAEKVAIGRMERGKWQKAEQSLRKATAKDSLNVEARFVLSLYYFNNSNPSYNLDSAYRYVHRAIHAFHQVPARDKERLRKLPIDSARLAGLKNGIDSASFERVKRLNTEGSYQYFIDHYPTALQIPAAIELRDEVAFLEALKINTWLSFKNFLTNYPESHRKKDAQERFDKLLYEGKTKDRKLISYARFLQQFPETPYRLTAEQNIFEISTASGSSASFRWFIENYPSSSLVRRAKNILFGLRKEESNDFDPRWMTDSLRNADALGKMYWVPVFKSGQYGFMDEAGHEKISPRFAGIAEDYRCGDVTDLFLITSAGLLARNGKVLWPAPVKVAMDIGSGYIKVTLDSGKHIVHESGFRVSRESYDDAQVVAGSLLAVKTKGKWSLLTLTGRSLTPSHYDEVTAVDSVIVLTRGRKKTLTTPGRMGKLANRVEVQEDLVVDDMRRWGDQQYWVRNGVLEGVIDARLNYLIPLSRQALQKTSFGFLQEKDDVYFIKGVKSLENVPYVKVQDHGGWIRLQTANGRHLLYDKTLKRLAEGDSSWFQGQLAFLHTDDSIKAFLPSGQRLSFSRSAAFYFKEYRDSAAWIVVEEKKGKAIYDAASGIRLFAMEFDQLEPLTPFIFVVTRQGKKGLVSEEGRLLVPVEYDAIVYSGRDSFSLLKEKKFGWYDAKTNLLIKPAFDRNIKGYNAKLHIAYRDKGYGFILPDGRPLGNFEWEEIQYWTDTVAWVKKNFQWILLNINHGHVRLDRVRNFSVVADTPSEKIYMVRQDNAFGVLSSRHGIVIPIQYSDIVNLGSREKPLYFTERHIEEAGISVVIYYDRLGKIIRKQAMEAEEFEKIYCDN